MSRDLVPRKLNQVPPWGSCSLSLYPANNQEYRQTTNLSAKPSGALAAVSTVVPNANRIVLLTWIAAGPLKLIQGSSGVPPHFSVHPTFTSPRRLSLCSTDVRADIRSDHPTGHQSNRSPTSPTNALAILRSDWLRGEPIKVLRGGTAYASASTSAEVFFAALTAMPMTFQLTSFACP